MAAAAVVLDEVAVDFCVAVAELVGFVVFKGVMTLSRTCIKPLFVSTFAFTTFALLNQISFPLTVTLTVSLLKLVNSCPSTKKSEYSGKGSVWKSSAVVSTVVFKVASALPAAAKALLLGPRQVTLGEWSSAGQRFVRFRALSREKREAVRMVVEQGAGGVRRPSMI